MPYETAPSPEEYFNQTETDKGGKWINGLWKSAKDLAGSDEANEIKTGFWSGLMNKEKTQNNNNMMMLFGIIVIALLIKSK